MTLEADSLPSKSSIFKINTHVFPLLQISWEHGKEGGGGFGVVDVEAVN